MPLKSELAPSVHRVELSLTHSSVAPRSRPISRRATFSIETLATTSTSAPEKVRKQVLGVMCVALRRNFGDSEGHGHTRQYAPQMTVGQGVS